MQQTTIMRPAIGSQPVRVPLFRHKVPAGFPSPADDYIQGRRGLDASGQEKTRKACNCAGLVDLPGLLWTTKW